MQPKWRFSEKVTWWIDHCITQLTTLLVMWLGKSTLTSEELQWSAA